MKSFKKTDNLLYILFSIIIVTGLLQIIMNSFHISLVLFFIPKIILAYYVFGFHNKNEKHHLFFSAFVVEIIVNTISFAMYILEYGTPGIFTLIEFLIVLLCFGVIILSYCYPKINIRVLIKIFLLILIIRDVVVAIDQISTITKLYNSGFRISEILKLCFRPIYDITYDMSLLIIVPKTLKKIRICSFESHL